MAGHTGGSLGDWGPAVSRANGTECNVSCPENLLTEQEVGRRLRISRSALFSLRRAGKIGYVQVGTSIRYRIGDVRRFIEENARGIG